MSNDERETASLEDHLYGDWYLRVWREQVNGRWVLYLTYGDRTYRLVPITEGEEQDRIDGEEQHSTRST